MIKKDVFSEIQDVLTRENNKEGMSQYLLFIYAEDVIFSKDLIIINLLNGSYSGLDVFEQNMAINEAVELLREKTNNEVIKIVVEDGMIAFKPLIINEFDSTKEFFLFSKKESGFILKDIYEKYFYNIDDVKLTYDVFINSNSAGMLSSDSNFIVYDDSDRISLSVLKQNTRLFHQDRLVPKSKLIDFIMYNVKERPSYIDYITNDLSDVMDSVYPSIVKEMDKLILSGDLTKEKAINNLKTYSLISSVTWYNIERLNKIDKSNKPGYNIGLTALFSKRT